MAAKRVALVSLRSLTKDCQTEFWDAFADPYLCVNERPPPTTRGRGENCSRRNTHVSSEAQLAFVSFLMLLSVLSAIIPCSL